VNSLAGSSVEAGAARRAPRAVRATTLSLALLVFVSCFALTAAAQTFGAKNVQGHVLGAQGKAINGAIVYLKNSSSGDIKTYISTDSGFYQFVDLSANTDYTVWAAWQGKKSSTKTVSSFDTRKKIYIDLHIK
jgi:hypothetical protein